MGSCITRANHKHIAPLLRNFQNVRSEFTPWSCRVLHEQNYTAFSSPAVHAGLLTASAHGGNFYSILTSIWILNNLKYQRNQHFKDYFFLYTNKYQMRVHFQQHSSNYSFASRAWELLYSVFLSKFPVCIVFGHSKNECILALQCVCVNSSCILVLLVAYYINNIIIFILGVGTYSILPVSHDRLQH